MRHAQCKSFSYSRLDLHSEECGSYSRQKGRLKSLKLLLQQQYGGSAPSPPEETRVDCGHGARQKLESGERSWEHFCRERMEEGARTRSQSAMESQQRQHQQSSEGTQIELRTDGFQATLLWERIVSHLEKNVKVGRHTYGLRSYDNCFPGHKVVDCLMGYMNLVLPKSVKKSQARLLGQKLLLTRVIEDARKKEKTVFRESRLYRFTGIHFWDPPSEVYGTRSCSTAATEGGVYRCHSIENINHGCPPANSNREHKRKPSSGRKNGYVSDSTLASSSLSRRVVHIRSSRGKRDAIAAKSQLTNSISSAHGVPNGVSSSSHSSSSSSHRSRIPWFHSDSGSRAREKHHTPTITEEPAVLRSISPPRASPMTPRSPAADFRVRDPRSLLPRPRPIYPERPHSPDSSVVSGISAYSRDSSQSGSVNLKDFTLHSRTRTDFFHQRLVPRAPTSTPVSTPTTNLSSGQSPQTEGGGGGGGGAKDWVVYGFV